MPSLKTSLLAVAATLLSAVRADYYVEPTSVPLATRSNWCTNEISSCPLICAQTSPFTTVTEVNSCDAKTLTYGCVCSNGLQPNVSEYSLTLPFFVCQEWGNQCVTGCGSNSTCSSSCREDHPCGALSPTVANTTATASTSATASSTDSSATKIYSNFGSAASSSGSAMPAFDTNRLVVLAATLAGLTAGVALAL